MMKGLIADEFKKYDRALIRISRNTAVLMHLFHKENDHDLESIWFEDICTDPDLYKKESIDIYEEAAQQFIDQFEGYWCIAFCKALRDKCDALIQEHEEMCKKTLK